MLKEGLDLAGLSPKRQERLGQAAKYRKFKSHFGAHPLHAASVWRDLLTTPLASAHITEDEASIHGFLAALNFLKVYAPEDVRDDFMGERMHLNKLRAQTWKYVAKIAALKPLKILWPAEWKTTFIISVDGTHAHINEPRDPLVKRNRKWYSHKHNSAGLNYEIALSLFESKIVHAKTGDPASKHDMTVFQMELKNKIPRGKRVVADKVYDVDDERHIVSSHNQFDTDEVLEFKKNARSRHETVNAKLKMFKCLDYRFRHGVIRAQQCFDSVLVLVQYAIEDTGIHGEPLFDL
jgi:IS5 family transposase